jgi:hypothetical protein
VVEVGSGQRDGLGDGPRPNATDQGDELGAPGGGGIVVVGAVVGEPLVVLPLGVVDSVGVVVSVVVGVGLGVVVVVLRGSCTLVRGTQV